MPISQSGVDLKYFCLFLFFLLTQGLFAAVPISGRSLQGATAGEARQKLIISAESFLGTPYRYAGLDRRGLDCSGLVYISFLEGLNYTAPRTTQSIYNWAQRIDRTELQPGDLVFFVTVGSTVSHVGIYTGGGRFIHSASDGPRTGVMYSSLSEDYWRRTYLGAGRVLPWDTDTAMDMAVARPAERQERRAAQELSWSGSGLFVGFGAACTWGGFFGDTSSSFRGISSLATVGYKWTNYRIGLEVRQEWDRALGVFRLPLTLSVGTDTFQVFAGPAYTFGEPSLDRTNGTRDYSGGNSFRMGMGVSAATPPIRLGSGALSIYGELAWQPYSRGDNNFNLKPDLTANTRIYTGLRYLWKI